MGRGGGMIPALFHRYGGKDNDRNEIAKAESGRQGWWDVDTSSALYTTIRMSIQC